MNGLAAADYNNDGYPDLAAVLDIGAINQVLAFGNDVDAIFDWSFHQVDVGAETQHVRCVIADDFDNDGDADLATGRDMGSGNEVSAWRNDLPHRNAPFSAQIVIANVAAPARSVHAADLDGDGDVDVLSASNGSPPIAWYENDGEVPPSFLPHAVSGGAAPYSVYSADLDEDGDLDVLSASWGDNEIEWYENDGAVVPTFTSHIIASDALGAHSVYAADLDGDGDVDVLSASINDDKVAWYENDGVAEPSFAPHTISAIAYGAQSVYAADLDGDGDVDVLSTSYSPVLEEVDQVVWYENDGATNPTFTSHVISNADDCILGVTVADMDGDGDLDVLSTHASSDRVVWHENSGTASPTFTSHIITNALNRPYSVHAVDLDQDGDLDVLSGSHSPGSDMMVWCENDGAVDPRSEKPTYIYSWLPRAYQIVLVDGSLESPSSPTTFT